MKSGAAPNGTGATLIRGMYVEGMQRAMQQACDRVAHSQQPCVEICRSRVGMKWINGRKYRGFLIGAV
jgi:hypothetical protein